VNGAAHDGAEAPDIEPTRQAQVRWDEILEHNSVFRTPRLSILGPISLFVRITPFGPCGQRIQAWFLLGREADRIRTRNAIHV